MQPSGSARRGSRPRPGQAAGLSACSVHPDRLNCPPMPGVPIPVSCLPIPRLFADLCGLSPGPCGMSAGPLGLSPGPCGPSAVCQWPGGLSGGRGGRCGPDQVSPPAGGSNQPVSLAGGRTTVRAAGPLMKPGTQARGLTGLTRCPRRRAESAADVHRLTHDKRHTTDDTRQTTYDTRHHRPPPDTRHKTPPPTA